MAVLYELSIVELIIHLTLIAFGFLILSIIFHFLAKALYYHLHLSSALHVVSNFFCITSSIVFFTAGFSAFLEAFVKEMFILYSLTGITMLVAVKFDKIYHR